MKVQLSITTDDGMVYTGEMNLEALASDGGPRKKRTVEHERRGGNVASVDFSLPVRPFMKRNARGVRSGPKRLTLLVARLAEGKDSAQIQRSEVIRLWNKMKSLMGGEFNSAYETRARDSGWVGSPKVGVYTLLPSWKEIFQ